MLFGNKSLACSRLRCVNIIYIFAYGDLGLENTAWTFDHLQIPLPEDEVPPAPANRAVKREKIHKQPAAPRHAIPVPARRFSHVHVDLVGSLPASSEGQEYLLTTIDRSARWVEAVPLRNMEARAQMPFFGTFLRAGHCHDRHGAHLSCVDLYLHVLTIAYHPLSNGMVERVHRQIKDALRACGAGLAWQSLGAVGATCSA